jgi:catechol 2,3-dioxygenase-like lactoylglutathione lyase family enzyme
VATSELSPPTDSAPVDPTTHPVVRVVGVDHLVLRVADPEKSLDFYVGVLGLISERVEEWRAGKAPFPSVRVTPDFVIDLDARHQIDGTNVDHFCLEIETTDLQALHASGALETVGQPVRRWGARGPADLIYVRDPDGHVIELRHYGESQGLEYGRR